MVARVEYLCTRLRGVSNLKHLEEFDTKLPKESHISGITLILHVRRAPLKEMGRKGIERRGITTAFRLSSSYATLPVSYDSSSDCNAVAIDPP